jgi:hypothetical protein
MPLRIERAPKRCRRSGALDHDQIIVPPLEAGRGEVRGAGAQQSPANLVVLEVHQSGRQRGGTLGIGERLSIEGIRHAVALRLKLPREAINQPEDSSMSRRFVVAMLGLGLALFFIPQISLAEEDHIAEAITHTKQAIDHGKQGHADVLTTHAEAALTHAEAGEKAKANSHTEEGITHLKQAIEEGKKGNAKMATTHAEAALTHLEQVK